MVGFKVGFGDSSVMIKVSVMDWGIYAVSVCG